MSYTSNSIGHNYHTKGIVAHTTDHTLLSAGNILRMWGTISNSWECRDCTYAMEHIPHMLIRVWPTLHIAWKLRPMLPTVLVCIVLGQCPTIQTVDPSANDKDLWAVLPTIWKLWVT